MTISRVSRMDPVARQDARGDLQILQASVGATAEHRLVDADVAQFGHRPHMVDRVRAGDLRFGDVLFDVDVDQPLVPRVRVRLIVLVHRSRRPAPHRSHEVRMSSTGVNATLAPISIERFASTMREATLMRPDRRAVELDRAIVGAVRAESPDDVEDQVLRRDPGQQPAVRLDAHRRRAP